MPVHIVLHSTDLICDPCCVIFITKKIVLIALSPIVVPSKSVIFSIRDVSSPIVDQVVRAIHLIGRVLCCDQVAREQQDDKVTNTLHRRSFWYERNYIEHSIDLLYDGNRILC